MPDFRTLTSASFLALTAACSGSVSRPTETPGLSSGEAVQWSNASPLVTDAEAEAQYLASLKASRSPNDRLIRLDRLVDLLDAARFGDDDTTRDALWLALGGRELSRGPEATNDALRRILVEAWELESQSHNLDDQGQDILAQLIQLISVDMNHPDEAESMEIRALVYRSLATDGHARISDNASWRLYDHIRGVLVEATSTPAPRNAEVAYHALLAEHDSIREFLQPLSPGQAPNNPSPQSYLELFDKPRTLLANDIRWTKVVEHRNALDNELKHAVRIMLPQERDLRWNLPLTSPGQGRFDPLAPVYLVTPKQTVVDAGSPNEQVHPAVTGQNTKQVTAQLNTLIARDGRGRVLLAIDSQSEGEQFANALGTLASAQTTVIDFAVSENESQQSQSTTTLPLVVIRPDDLGPGEETFIDARIRLRLGNNSWQLLIDEAPVDRPQQFSSTPSSPPLLQALAEAHVAFPLEEVVTMELGSSLKPQNLATAIASVIGSGTTFDSVGWIPGPLPLDASKQTAPSPEARSKLKVRTTLRAQFQPPKLEQPYPLRPEDQGRLVRFGKNLNACLAEFESTFKRGQKVKIETVFEQGTLQQSQVKAKGKSKARRLSVQECVDKQSLGVRLREHRDRIEADFVFEAKS